MLSNGYKRQYIPRYKLTLIIWSFSFLSSGFLLVVLGLMKNRIQISDV